MFSCFIYYFIKYGIENGVWSSIRNTGFFVLIFSLIALFMTLIMYFNEKKRKSTTDDMGTFVIAQIISVCDMFFVIILIFYLE